MDETAPILLFDSGVGGLTVLAELRKLLPDAPVIYAADLAGLPYGEKTEAEIKRFLKTHMYRHERVMRVMRDAERVVRDLFARYRAEPTDLPSDWLPPEEHGHAAAEARRIGDFIAGMTDRYAITEHRRLFDSTPDLR